MRTALLSTFARLRTDEKGVTLVEYGIALCLAIAVGTVLLTTLAAAINGEVAQAAGIMNAQ